jgi:hypothetical protein
LATADFVRYAQIASGVAATCALGFTAWQFRRARKTATLQNIQDFFKATTEREAALREAALANASDEGMRHALVEFLNLLEIYSAALNANLFVDVAEELVLDKVLDSIVELEGAPHWHQEIELSIRTAATYKHLRLLIERNRRELDQRRLAVKSFLDAKASREP